MGIEYSRKFLDELCAKNDIISVAGRYLQLTKKGRTYWACCPFHKEKTPSFAVDEYRQFYHCFGCGEHGNVISFIQKMESLDFPKTVEFLAELAGIELPKESDRKFEAERSLKKNERDLLLSLNREAAKHYHQNLYKQEGKPALDYLIKRGITEKWIKRFGLGVSAGFSQVIKHLRSLGFTDKQMALAGLTAKKGASKAETETRGANNSYYDVFAGRLIFPIIDNFGNVLAFGGRILDNADFAKYRNSSNTPVFDKSAVLYAHNLLKNAKTEHNIIDYVLLAEGYIDVMALHAGGFDTAVASMGTALTFEQARIIKRYTENVVILYDGDGAGQKATLKAIDILKRAGLNAKASVLPDNLDPDDYLKKYGSESLKKLIGEALSPFDYKLYILRKKYDLTLSGDKMKFTNDALSIVSSVQNAVEQEEYLLKLRDITGYTLDSLKKQLSNGITNDGVKSVLASQKIYGAEEKASRFVLNCLISRYDFLNSRLDALISGKPYITGMSETFDFTQFLSPSSLELYNLFLDKEITVAHVADGDALSEDAFKLLSELSIEDFALDDEKSICERFDACIRLLLREKLSKDAERLSLSYEKSAPDEKIEILKKINEIGQKIKTLKES